MTYEETLSHFRIKSRQGDKAQAQCPCHDDKQASLTISRGRKCTLVKCHAGCPTQKVVAAVGLNMKDLFYEDCCTTGEGAWRAYVESREGRRIEARYDYVSLNGDYGFTKLRLEGKKIIYGKLVNDRFTYGLGRATPRKSYKAIYAPQGIEKLKQAISSGKLICIPEGEKDVDNLIKNEFVACTYGGASDWQQDLASFFAGANVVILADNDKPGRDVAHQAAADLATANSSVKVIVPMQDIPKADVSDFFEQGGTAEQLIRMIEQTPEYKEGNHVKEERIAAVNPIEVISHKLYTLDACHAYKMNDKGSSQLFAKVFEDSMRYCPLKKDWMTYDSIRWRQDNEGMAARHNTKLFSDGLIAYLPSIRFMDESGQSAYIKYAAGFTNYNVRKRILEDSKDCCPIDAEDFDRNDFLLNVSNGTLALDGDKPILLPHKPEDLITKLAPVEYDPEAKCPLWEKTVNEIMQGNAEKLEYLQKMLGMALTGDTSEEEFYIFYGATTRNGKSTICDTMLHILGDYADTITPETLATKQNKDSRSASPDIAKLQGVRLVIASEPPRKMPLDSALVKTLTGRDKITARRLYESEISFMPKFKLLINTNYLPYTNDPTLFSSERVQVISFDKHFSQQEQDKQLKNRLLHESSGILNWLIDGWMKYKRDGLEPPQSIMDATGAYQKESDKIGQFFNECLTRSIGVNISGKRTYEVYAGWCDDNGYRVESKGTFFAELKTRGLLQPRGYVKAERNNMANVICNYDFRDDFVQVGDTEKIPF